MVACANCELLFISPYPKQSEEVYETVAEYSYEDLTILSPERHYEASKRLYDESFSEMLPFLDGAKSVLDVGCGTGHLLERVGEIPGIERCGLELKPQPSGVCSGSCEV